MITTLRTKNLSSSSSTTSNGDKARARVSQQKSDERILKISFCKF